MVLVLSNLPRLAGEMTSMRLLSRDPDAHALLRVQSSAPSRGAVPVSVRRARAGLAGARVPFMRDSKRNAVRGARS